MKAKPVLIALIIAVLALTIGLIVTGKKASQEKIKSERDITRLSNNCVSVQGQLDLEKAERIALETNFHATKIEYSNKLVTTESDLARTAANLNKTQSEAKAAADAAAAEIAQRDKKIQELESQNQTLDKTANDLRSSITNLTSQIDATEQKLARAEGDRDFLLKELKRLKDEKADLERKFNDIAQLRDQIHKLKEEMSISRRLDMIRRGFYANPNIKGGERMIRSLAKPDATPGTNNTLNVEIKQNGEKKVESQPAPAPKTNAPAPAPAPAPAGK
jgi:chromosome segregation ATPase